MAETSEDTGRSPNSDDRLCQIIKGLHTRLNRSDINFEGYYQFYIFNSHPYYKAQLQKKEKKKKTLLEILPEHLHKVIIFSSLNLQFEILDNFYESQLLHCYKVWLTTYLKTSVRVKWDSIL